LNKPSICDDPGSVDTSTTQSVQVRPAVNETDEHAQDQVDLELPDVTWISATHGSRALGDLEDQAAGYRANGTSSRSTPTFARSRT